MKFIIAFVGILAVAAALPVAPSDANTKNDAVVLKYTNDNIGIGHYTFG